MREGNIQRNGSWWFSRIDKKEFSDSGIPVNPKNNENETYYQTHHPESTQHQRSEKKLKAVREKDRAL